MCFPQHSMYALHLRRWLQTFPLSSVLLLRFDEIVLRPIDAINKFAAFLSLPPFAQGFKVPLPCPRPHSPMAKLAPSPKSHALVPRALPTFLAVAGNALHRGGRKNS